MVVGSWVMVCRARRLFCKHAGTCRGQARCGPAAASPCSILGHSASLPSRSEAVCLATSGDMVGMTGWAGIRGLRVQKREYRGRLGQQGRDCLGSTTVIQHFAMACLVATRNMDGSSEGSWNKLSWASADYLLVID